MEDNKRRKFIKNVGLGAAAIGAGIATSAVPAMAKKEKTYNWKMVTTWPPHFPMLGESADKIAQWVDEMSGGRLKISVYGGGELVPAMGTFDAVSQGTVEMGHAASYYWAGKVPAAQFFAAVPFGFNAQSINAWILSGGGMELWEEVYAKFNIKPFLAGNTGAQMGGWFNKEINSMEDFKGLKMRIPGLAGKVLAKAGGSAILMAGGDIYTNLERGVIDATEWVGPFHDLKLGFYKAAKYYYYPGWHEPTACIEAIINQQAYDALPVDLQKVVDMAAMAANQNMLSEYTANNQRALETLQQDHHVQLRAFPEDVLQEFKKYANQVLIELGQQSELSQKIFNSYTGFAEQTKKWLAVSEMAYLKAR